MFFRFASISVIFLIKEIVRADVFTSVPTVNPLGMESSGIRSASESNIEIIKNDGTYESGPVSGMLPYLAKLEQSNRRHYDHTNNSKNNDDLGIEVDDQKKNQLKKRTRFKVRTKTKPEFVEKIASCRFENINEMQRKELDALRRAKETELAKLRADEMAHFNRMAEEEAEFKKKHREESLRILDETKQISKIREQLAAEASRIKAMRESEEAQQAAKLKLESEKILIKKRELARQAALQEQEQAKKNAEERKKKLLDEEKKRNEEIEKLKLEILKHQEIEKKLREDQKKMMEVKKDKEYRVKVASPQRRCKNVALNTYNSGIPAGFMQNRPYSPYINYGYIPSFQQMRPFPSFKMQVQENSGGPTFPTYLSQRITPMNRFDSEGWRNSYQMSRESPFKASKPKKTCLSAPKRHLEDDGKDKIKRKESKPKQASSEEKVSDDHKKNQKLKEVVKKDDSVVTLPMDSVKLNSIHSKELKKDDKNLGDVDAGVGSLLKDLINTLKHDTRLFGGVTMTTKASNDTTRSIDTSASSTTATLTIVKNAILTSTITTPVTVTVVAQSPPPIGRYIDLKDLAGNIYGDHESPRNSSRHKMVSESDWKNGSIKPDENDAICFPITCPIVSMYLQNVPQAPLVNSRGTRTSVVCYRTSDLRNSGIVV